MKQNVGMISSELDEEDAQSSFPLIMSLDWEEDVIEMDNGVPIPAALNKTTSLEIDDVVEAALVRWASKNAPDSSNESTEVSDALLLTGDLEDDNDSVVGDDGIEALVVPMAKKCAEWKVKSDPEVKEDEEDDERVDRDRKRAVPSSQSQSHFTPPAPTGSRRKKKPKGMPKRPLSAYNIFFQRERPKVLQSGDESAPKVGFQELAKTIGKRWGILGKEDRREYEKLAEKDKIRYRLAMETFKGSGSDDENTVSLPDDLKSAQSGEPVSSASAFGNITVSTGPPPAPIAFFNNVAGPLQARLPWGEPLASRQHGGQHGDSPPLYLPLQGMQQQQLYNRASDTSFSQGMQQQSQSVIQGIQQQQFHNRASNTTFLQGVQQQQQQPRPSAPQPPPVLMPSKPCEDPRQQQSFPIPMGMEVVLPDHNGVERRYTVQYSLYSMKRDDAMNYMERLSTAGLGLTNEQNDAKQEGGDTSKSGAETQR
jgi:hypothetical protein